jgi:cobyrinic acid a,c-diamide synthase
VRVARDNPFFKTGQILRGHEFHYSTVMDSLSKNQLAFDMERGSGLADHADGLCRKNVLATYTHIHALGTPQWAPALVAKARRYRRDTR